MPIYVVKNGERIRLEELVHRGKYLEGHHASISKTRIHFPRDLVSDGVEYATLFYRNDTLCVQISKNCGKESYK